MTLPAAGPHDLTFTRRLKASRKTVWRCWTEPDLLVQWFCPKPWQVSRCIIDLRPGGHFLTDMAGPDGAEHKGEGGVFLDVVPMERLAFTSALTKGWRPATEPDGGFPVTIILTLHDSADGGTLYDVLLMHRDAAGRDAHLAMGFNDGWGKATEQLEDLAGSL